MAKASVLKHMGDTLVYLLSAAVGNVVSNINVVTPEDIKAIGPNSPPQLTIFLYKIAVNFETRNGYRRVLPDGSHTRPLLPLDLSYLITPWAVRADDEHLLMGSILQALYDHSELAAGELQGDSWDSGDSVQLILESLPLEDHYRIWDAFEVPYRLSLPYTARVVGIEPTRVRVEPPVVLAMFGKRA